MEADAQKAAAPRTGQSRCSVRSSKLFRLAIGNAPRNVRDSDVTVIFTFGEELEGGSKLMARHADSLGRPWLHFWAAVDEGNLVYFLERHNFGC